MDALSPSKGLVCRALVLVVLVYAGDLCASIQPSFNVTYSSWNATDILVLAPTLEPGQFRVIETIKGQTQPKTILVLKELAPSPGITSPISQLIPSDPFSNKPFEGIPPLREIDRLFVFLRQPGAEPEYNPRPDLPLNTVGWQPADLESLKTSAVWLQDGVAYGFRQTMNPGPSHLVPLLAEHEGPSGEPQILGEAELRSGIDETLRQRQELDDALSDPDPAARAKKLAELVKSDRGIAGQSALRHLESGGRDAQIVLQESLADETMMPWYDEILKALLETGITTFDFNPVIQSETAYWTEKCPTLKPGWWNDTSDWPAVEVPRSHYGRIYSVLQAIHSLKLKGSTPFLLKFSSVWNTCPSLDESEPLEKNQISEELRFLLSPAFH